MVNKTVMSVNMDCYKCKRMALRSVTEMEGIDSIEFNMKGKTITVVGEADPVCTANQIIRKFKCARLVSHAQLPPPSDPKAKPNNPTPPKTQTNPSNPNPPNVVLIICYPPYMIHDRYNAPPHCHCGCSPCSCRSDIEVYLVKEETPCTIC